MTDIEKNNRINFGVIISLVMLCVVLTTLILNVGSANGSNQTRMKTIEKEQDKLYINQEKFVTKEVYYITINNINTRLNNIDKNSTANTKSLAELNKNIIKLLEIKMKK